MHPFYSIIFFLQLISLCCTLRPLPPLFRRPCLLNNVKQNESEQLISRKKTQNDHLFSKIDLICIYNNEYDKIFHNKVNIRTQLWRHY